MFQITQKTKKIPSFPAFLNRKLVLKEKKKKEYVDLTVTLDLGHYVSFRVVEEV